jgi:hypothetical protein
MRRAEWPEVLITNVVEGAQRHVLTSRPREVTVTAAVATSLLSSPSRVSVRSFVPRPLCRESGSDVGRRRQAPKQLPMCLLFTIKRPSRFRPPSTTKRRALAPASFAASLRPQGLDMIVLLGRRKKAGPCTGRVERRQFCNTNNPAESRRQPSWFSRDGNHARLLQPLPLRHGQPLEFVIVDNGVIAESVPNRTLSR